MQMIGQYVEYRNIRDLKGFVGSMWERWLYGVNRHETVEKTLHCAMVVETNESPYYRLILYAFSKNNMHTFHG